VADITRDRIHTADAIITRDCLGHFSSDSIDKALENIWLSNPKFLIATHWPEAPYKDIEDGQWRPINMWHYLDPQNYDLVDLIEEDYPGKFLGVWMLK
jgi:hypothetical protein